ncbi:MAG: TetR/AcrR family transcriptional regulator [Solirubrobacteraceae bacterium]
MTGAALTRREKQQHTRKCLLKAAAKLFCKHGLEGTSIDQVAEEAGYTKGAFYANFKNKEELFLVMLDERFSNELERLDRALAGGDDPYEQARSAAANFIHFASDDEWPGLYFQFAAHAARNEEFRQEFATRQAAMRARLVTLYDRWIKGFSVEPPLPLEDIAAMTYFMADGFLVDRLIEPDLGEELYSTMLSVFLKGLEALANEREQRP